MVRAMRKKVIICRVGVCRRILRLNTRRIRKRLLTRLGDIFTEAQAHAQDQQLDLKEREKWARASAFVAQTIDELCSKFDEQQIDADLAELERLVNEAREKAKDGNTETEASNERKDSDS